MNAGTKNLVPFTKDDPRINRKGRPRKEISLLKVYGYNKQEITDCILVMMSLTLEELKAIFDNPNATILEKMIANALFTSLKKGSFFAGELLLNRAIGTPQQTSEVNMTASIQVLAPDGETADLINKL